MIQTATLDDLENIIKLWKHYRQSLGIPWRKNIAGWIKKNTFFVCYDGDKLISMGGYNVMPIKKEIWILAIAVDKDYQRKHYGTQMLKYIQEHIESTVQDRFPVYLSYVLGDDNNLFYDKFRGSWEYIGYNTYSNIVTEIYKIPVNFKHTGLF